MITRPLPVEDLDHVLVNTYPFWNDAKGKKFFITGGTGFFGFWLLESFAYINDKLNLGMSACVLTRNIRKFKLKAPYLVNRLDITFVEGDIRTFEYLEGEYSYVIHAATDTSADYNKGDPNVIADTIIEGTKRIADFCIRTGVRKVLFTSSGAIYGPQPSELPLISEDYRWDNFDVNNLTAYAKGKRAAEEVIITAAMNNNFDAKIARCFAFVGPHLPLDGHFAIGNFIRDAITNNVIKINGDGTPYRSYLYASDLAVWLWTILFSGVSCRPYNVGSSDYLSIKQLAAVVLKSLQSKADICITEKRQPDGRLQRYVPDIKRANIELNLKVEVKLESAIIKTALWYNLL
jgi:nucleoside-diphosphate-sugar epimerase